LNAKIKQDHARGIDHVDRCAAILLSELKLCKEAADGQMPTLVAMGTAAFSWLTGDEGDGRIAQAVEQALGAGASSRVRRMDHYTFGSGTHESRIAVLQPIVKEVLEA
jgi:hypothetical protein